MRMLLIGTDPQFRTFSAGDVLRFEYTTAYGFVLTVTTAEGARVQFVDEHGNCEPHYRLGNDILTEAIAKLIAHGAGTFVEHKACNYDTEHWCEYTLAPASPH